MLDRIEHTVAVLEAAVRASRKDLYQPSTAQSVTPPPLPPPQIQPPLTAPARPCAHSVISSIRTVLASTQCLTRDSPLLKTHPALSSARKRILSALAQLVNVARKASAPAGEPLDEEEGPGAPGRELVGVARETFGLVRTFLERAQQVGVRVDLEHANDLAPPSAAAAAAAGSTPKLGASTGRPPSRSKSRSPSAAGAGARAGAPTSPSPNAAAHQEDPGAEVRLSTAEAVAAHLSTLHDALLSTLAGLIAHLHAIASGTGRNPSARTVDLTREAVERVREVVRVSERVARAAGGGRPHGEEEEGSLARLAKEREGLYQATVALVAAARRATEPEAGGGGESEGEGEGEAGRKDLLEAATAVVRAGGECVSAIERVVQAQLLLVAPPSDHGGGAGAGAGGGGSNLASELVLPKIRTAEQLAADVSAGPRAGDGPAEGGGTADAAGGGMATAESADTIRALGDRGGSDSSTLLGLLGQHVASLGVLKERLDADVQSAPDLANRADRLTLYEGDGGSVTAPLSPQARSASPVPTTTLSTSPAETVVPAAAAAASDSLAPASVPRTSLSARSSHRRSSTAGAAAGDTSSSGAMVRQQSTESAHSHSSSHVTNLSLASTAALTDQTDETSPRTSLAAGAAVAAGSIYHHGKRVSSSPGSPRPSSRQEAAAAGLAPLAIPARLSSSSTSSSREAGVSSPSLPFNYALPTSSSASLPSAVATPAPTTALSPPASAAATTTATTHTSGAPTSTTSGGLWFLERDYEPREISFNADGHVSGGTLRCLVERLTLHDTTIDPGFSNTFLLTFRMFVSPLELARLLWTRFDLAPPAHPQTGAALSPEEHKKWTAQKLTPVRLRVYNLFKTWVETYWLHDSDCEVIDELLEWCQGRLKEALPAPSKRLTDLVNKRVAAAAAAAAGLDASGKRSSLPSEFGMRQGGATGSGVSSVLSPDRSTPTLGSGSQGSTSSNGGSSTGRGLLKSMQSMDRLRQGFNSTAASAAGGHTSPPPLPSADVYSPSAAQASNAPPPVITKSQIAALRPVQSGRTPLLTSITELDPLELARQLTIMESRVYCAIRPDELLSAATANGSDGGAGSRGSTNEGPRGQNVRKMSALSTRLSGWIAEAILNEHDQKRRTALVKFYVKLGEVRIRARQCARLEPVVTDPAVGSTLNSTSSSWGITTPSLQSLRRSARRQSLACRRRGTASRPSTGRR